MSIRMRFAGAGKSDASGDTTADRLRQRTGGGSAEQAPVGGSGPATDSQ